MKKDIVYLAIIQMLRFIVPLITFPYLTKTLGVKYFGLLAYGAGIIAYFTMVVEFGFNKTATAKVAKIKSDKLALSEYVWSVFFCQIFLFIVCVFLIIIAVYTFEVDSELRNVILILSLSVFGSIFTPTWFFLGMGKMKEQIPIVLTGRILTIPIILLFVKGATDTNLAAFLQSSAFLVSSLISCIYIKKSGFLNNISFNIETIKEAYKDSIYVFLTSFASNMYIAAVPVIIGVMLGPVFVGYYKVADNIKSISLSMMSPIYNVIYTRFNTKLVESRLNAYLLLKKYFIISLIIASIGSSIIFFLSHYIILVVSNEKFLSAEILLKIVPFIIVLSVINQFFGVQSLVSIGLSKEFSFIVVCGGLVCLSIIFPLVHLYGIVGAMLGVLISELSIGILLIGFHKKKKLNILI